MSLLISGDLRLAKGYDGFTDDADATAYLAAVQAADGQVLDPAVRLAVNSFIKGCKADGIWPAIKASCILAGARTLNGALVPLVGTAPTNVNFVSGDYNRETGLVGDGSTKYLDSNRAGNADPQNSNHLSAYVSTTGIGFAMGYGNGSSSDTLVALNTAAANVPFRSRGVNAFQTRSTVNATGFLGVNRSASSIFVSRLSSANETINSNSLTPLSNNYFVFGRSVGSPAYSTARIAFYSIGESLDLALLDARVTDLINAFAAAIP
jgi:hypothetical protein